MFELGGASQQLEAVASAGVTAPWRCCITNVGKQYDVVIRVKGAGIVPVW